MALEMSELIQAQGRGGRDGEPARCFIFPAVKGHQPTIAKNAEDHKGQWYAYDHIYVHGTNRCLRYGATLYIDGKGVECKLDMTNILCSVCKGIASATSIHTAVGYSSHTPNTPAWPKVSHSGVEAPGYPQPLSISKHTSQQTNTFSNGDPFAPAAHVSKKKRVDRLGGVFDEADRMRRALNKVKDHGCGMCLVFCSTPQHKELFHCPPLQKLGGFAVLIEWKKTLRYQHAKGICWRCHVPSCSDMLHGPFGDSNTKCEWEDVVIPTILAIWGNLEMRKRAQIELGLTWADGMAYSSWLTGTPSPGYHSRVMELFLWYVERVVGM